MYSCKRKKRSYVSARCRHAVENGKQLACRRYRDIAEIAAHSENQKYNREISDDVKQIKSDDVSEFSAEKFKEIFKIILCYNIVFPDAAPVFPIHPGEKVKLAFLLFSVFVSVVQDIFLRIKTYLSASSPDAARSSLQLSAR